MKTTTTKPLWIRWQNRNVHVLHGRYGLTRNICYSWECELSHCNPSSWKLFPPKLLVQDRTTSAVNFSFVLWQRQLCNHFLFEKQKSITQESRPSSLPKQWYDKHWYESLRKANFNTVNCFLPRLSPVLPITGIQGVSPRWDWTKKALRPKSTFMLLLLHSLKHCKGRTKLLLYRSPSEDVPHCTCSCLQTLSWGRTAALL